MIICFFFFNWVILQKQSNSKRHCFPTQQNQLQKIKNTLESFPQSLTEQVCINTHTEVRTRWSVAGCQKQAGWNYKLQTLIGKTEFWEPKPYSAMCTKKKHSNNDNTRKLVKRTHFTELCILADPNTIIPAKIPLQAPEKIAIHRPNTKTTERPIWGSTCNPHPGWSWSYHGPCKKFFFFF